jgi:hypothetical protein
MRARIAVLVVALLLVGSLQVVHGAGESQALATGRIHWTRNSVCEHPLHLGLFLQYYLTDGCGNELFLYGRLSQSMVGSTVWAEGTLLQNGGCTILDIANLHVCQSPSPGR